MPAAASPATPQGSARGAHGWARFAREVIAAATSGRATADVPAPELPARAHGGVFVTLHRDRQLRGCMGLLEATTPLPEAIRQAAVCAALQDPRFDPVQPAELADLDVEVSILSAPRPLRCIDELELGLHGILVRRGGCRGLFLPQVAVEHRLDKEDFLSRCCAEKAGLPPDAWRQPGTEVLVFTTEVVRD